MSYEPSFSLRSLIDGTPSPSPSIEVEKPRNPASEAIREATASSFDKFKTDPIGYVERHLGFSPWAGRNGKPGQRELYQDIAESVEKQLAGIPTIRIFRVEAGHGLGKTWGCAGLVNWFFDCFAPSVTITTAPSKEQVDLLLWKDIKTQRKGKTLGGRVLPSESRMERSENHFAIGRTTSDSGGKGTNRAQGQHNEYSMFVLDEAEGVPKFFFEAVEAMMTGGRVVIVILIANPQTRTSEFFKWGRRSDVKSYRFSLLDFPNVLDGAPTVPGGTNRDWVSERLGRWCEVVSEHDEALYTFELPFDAEMLDGTVFPGGTIFQPSGEFQFRVMGVPPSHDALRSFVSGGVYEAAKVRAVEPTPEDVRCCRIGVDVARFGMDRGTVWKRHEARVRRTGSLHRQETDDYVKAVKDAAMEAVARRATSVHVRVDGTGGFGAGVIDALRKDSDLRKLPDFKVFEVHFASSAHDRDAFDNIITECYYHAGESLKGLRLEGAPEELEADLCDRLFEYVNKSGKTLKRLEPKENFRKRHKSSEHPDGRSPDDGDGVALAIAPDFVFAEEEMEWDIYG